MLFSRTLCLLTLGFMLAGCSNDRAAPVKDAGKYTSKTRGSISSNLYTVAKGDTLYSISWRAGLDPKTLAQRNNIAPPYTIFVGQKLRLGATKPATNSNSSTKATAKASSAKTQSKPVAQKKTNKSLESNNSKAYANKSQAVNKSTTSAAVKTWRWPTSGRVIKGFSAAESGNKGIDIEGNRGQKILASAPGKVVYAGSALRGYGQLVIVKHNDDFLSAYAHNSLIRVKEKDSVKAGQHIADMGDTGTSSTRLHFEIRYKGKSVDPMKYLPKR
ncbi:LysM peptidoglycan-binding domain-containing protein [Alginatibacterium sediminis]|uniref:LysM peptidoglycan-binding domain-containing protein n=1 Tax=Alginatibacterium sediminis TaxID=2164068 RepID=A0A420EDB9_9ALTE|nr:peptidoglycan DD-metalloendopeptidase family protein [Alginatibacterium sediminis]RKF18622.1 LysM peptidoglycan-binding domain-containing protein [Alginatibacterium sediminis]